MMKWIQADPWRIESDTYTLEPIESRPALRWSLRDGTRLGELFLVPSVHTLTGRDMTTSLQGPGITGEEDSIRLRWTANSSLWQKKGIDVVASDQGLTYTVWVEGEGVLDEVELLSGYYSGVNPRHGTARYYSAFYADAIMNPEPTCEERRWLPQGERTLIDLMGVPIPGRDHWFFTPPPFCFILRNGEAHYTLGVTAQPGHHTFTEYEYLGGSGGGLRLRYDGHQQASGRYELPTVHLLTGSDPYALLGEFSAIERTQDTAKERPTWWNSPIFCGWGAQCAMTGEYKQPAPALARQDFYERFTASLDEKRIDPGIVVIDDKWQLRYGQNDVDTEKWPDMRAFIRAMHDKGRKVLLWLKAWDPEGVPAELCIRDFAGNALAIDPTNPAYLSLFEGALHSMLSPEGLDADGFKIDFTARIPSGPHLTLHDESIWGLELMRAYLAMVYDGAKAIKPDALIMCHCPHPYLQDKCDMIRLNDVNTARPVNEQMTHRALVARAAMPDCLIDTDNWPMPTKAAWLDYVRIQPELGIPSLYYLWHMDNSDEVITDEDLDIVREAWARAREQQ